MKFGELNIGDIFKQVKDCDFNATYKKIDSVRTTDEGIDFVACSDCGKLIRSNVFEYDTKVIFITGVW